MKVIIIEENHGLVKPLQKMAASLDLEIHQFSDLKHALRFSEENGADIVLMRDIIGGHPSCFAIGDFRNTSLMPDILIYTEAGDPEHAEYALEGGAWDYVVDNALAEKLPDMLRRLARYRRNNEQGEEVRRQEVQQQLQHHGVIGSSAAMQNCLSMVAKVGQSDASVLITGETGTGKELFASAIHDISPRHRNSMTIIDCAALPSTLVESILFGHAKGAFTGADKSRKGLVKQADGGTLFLDEIGEMPLEIQKKFLRVLQEQKYLPVGSSSTEKSDFRLIAATNRNLETMVEERTFREDLLFRLKTFQLELPPLRTRRTDIAELTYHFRNIYCRRNKLKRKKLATDYLMLLNQYHWPGNVRELFQAVEYSITEARDSTILEAAHLPVNIRLSVTKQKLQNNTAEQKEPGQTNLPDQLSSMPTIKEDREHAIQVQEKHYLERLLQLSEGNIKQCCEIAGLSRSRLYDLLKKYDLSQKGVVLHSQE